jgi:hypothetical protein
LAERSAKNTANLRDVLPFQIPAIGYARTLAVMNFVEK